MPLHPESEAFIAALKAQNAPAWDSMPASQARDVFAGLGPLFGEPVEVDSIQDIRIQDQIPARVYRSSANDSGRVVVYYHGGGWVLGNIETHHALCSRIAQAGQTTVVSVDYRLAPDHPFPAAFDDCYDAAAYVSAHPEDLGIDPQKLVVAGDSAGGNLAAAVAIQARDKKAFPIHSQLLIYPVIDTDFETQSYRDCAEDFGLTRDVMKWFWRQYIGDSLSTENPLAAPGKSTDLTNLPPASILLAEYDILRDEGLNYARRLEQAGNPVHLKQYEGLLHGFIHFSGAFDSASQAIQDIGEILHRIS